MEILETGALRRIGYERTEDVEVTRLFQGIYGVGMLSQSFHLKFLLLTHCISRAIDGIQMVFCRLSNT
jgi:hypothetical protein